MVELVHFTIACICESAGKGNITRLEVEGEREIRIQREVNHECLKSKSTVKVPFKLFGGSYTYIHLSGFYLEKLGWGEGGNRMYTPTYSGHTHFY